MSASTKKADMTTPSLLSSTENLDTVKEIGKKTVTKSTKRKSIGDDAENDESTSTASKKKKTNAGASSSKTPDSGDLFSITLDGDDDEKVEIYDSCDEIRRKINAALREGGVTKTRFLADIARAGWPTNAPKIQSKQLSDFLTKKGATAGSTSRVFYGAYVYFEKKRLAEGKGKSKHRKDMENRWEGQGGLPRERERGYWVPSGSNVVQDKLGSVRVQHGR